MPAFLVYVIPSVKVSPLIRFTLAVICNGTLYEVAWASSKWRSDERALFLEFSGAGLSLLALVVLFPLVVWRRGYIRVFAIGLCILPLLALVGLIHDSFSQ